MIEQVFVISGSSPVLWTIPVWLNFEHPKSAEGVIFAAVSLLGPHIEALKALLANCSVYQNGMWRIDRQTLGRIAERVDMTTGVQIEELFTWERRKTHQADPPSREEHKDIDEFLDSLYQAGLPISRDWLAVIYHQICLHALDWLVNKERPLDLYFAKLHNCPYRANWKESLNIPRRRVTEDVALTDYGLLSMSHPGVINRWLEAEPTSLWFKKSSLAERSRVQLLGRSDYIRHVLGSIIRFKQSAGRIFAQWQAAAGKRIRSHATHWRELGFRVVLSPTRVAMPVRRRKTAGWSHLASIDTPYDDYRNSLSGKDTYLRGLPAFQPSETDLRNGWGKIQEPEHGPNGQSGVLVPHAGQSGDTVQLLGAQCRVDDRLAGCPEQFSEPAA